MLALSDFAARDVFCCPRVAELPACVLSVAGAMRTGKSFLLDQMVSLFLASVLMEWSEIFYFRFAALHRAVVQGSLGEAGWRGTPVESISALRSPYCFLIVFQPDFQFLLLHFTFALHLYFSTTSSHSLWSATVNSWLSSSWTLRFGRVEISQPQGTFDYRTTIIITITITCRPKISQHTFSWNL